MAMTQMIEGSKPRLLNEKHVFLRVPRLVENEVATVPAGMILVVPAHGSGANSLPERRYEFPAGTQYRLVRRGNIHETSVTEILTSVLDPVR